jgi:hypothetical protein
MLDQFYKLHPIDTNMNFLQEKEKTPASELYEDACVEARPCISS